MTLFGFYLFLMVFNALAATYIGWRAWTETKVIKLKDIIGFSVVVLAAMFVPFVDLVGAILALICIIGEAWDNNDKDFWLNKRFK